MASTGSTSLSKRVARRNCFKSRIFQLNGNTNYGDNPKNSRSSVINGSFGRNVKVVEMAAVA